MKKIQLVISFLILISIAFAQEKTYKSSSSIKRKSEYETITVSRNVTIAEKKIIITNFINGGKEDLNLNIEKIVKKDYCESPCIWYYCVSQKEDPISGFTKYIVIIPDLKFPKEINVFQFSDEVTIFHTKIFID